MRIKTITCHNVYNYGASLQAYALTEYLKKLGHEAKIINYNPSYLQHYYLWGHVNPKYNRMRLSLAYNLAKLPERTKSFLFDPRKKAFDQFTRDFLPLTSANYVSIEELIKNPPEAEAYIAGSDQIWNSMFYNGKDPAFYLQFGSEKQLRISYAASFGSDYIESSYKDRISEWLSRFNAISVREQSGIRILNELGIHKAEQVLDPVFLLGKDEWRAILKDKDKEEKYVLFYGFGGDTEAERKACLFAHSNGMKLYSMNNSSIGDRCYQNEGPLRFLSLIDNATLIITSSFHAMAFSLIFQKDFLAFRRKESINSRLIDLLEMLDLGDHLVDCNEFESKYINYNKVYQILNQKICESKRFLSESIGNNK